MDLEEIWDYIAADNVDAADTFLASIEQAMQQLARMPGMGHTRDDLTSLPLLFWPVGAYLILYRPQALPLEIVAVVRGARDIPQIIERRLHH
jgi:antitoxin ParD1/3/4/toxin ParE1/3/4